MAKHLNVFSAGGLETFAVSQTILNRLLTLPDKKPTTLNLYLYLLSRANGPVVRLHTPTLLEEVGISRDSWETARAALDNAKLVLAKQVPNTKGWWQYELFGPQGGKLPTWDGFVDFEALTSEQIEAYYGNRLGVPKAPANDWKGNLRFDCPFCSARPGKLTLTVGLEKGKNHSLFICGNRHCRRKGGLIKFEQLLAQKQGKAVTKTEAARAVGNFMQSRDVHQDGDHIHPAVAQMMNEHHPVSAI